MPSSKPRRPAEPPLPARMTETALAEAAAFYLSRYASSSGNLRQVLVRKLRRSAHYYGDDPAALMGVIDALVARHVEAGAIDDANYAENQIRKLRRRGGSARVISQRLAAKGVPADAVGDSTFGGPADDLLAAVQLARRRRLGPFRSESRDDYRQKDMAVLGRAGFGYATAAQVVDAADADALALLTRE